jgi:RNA polymerase sigma-70 factor, ECF subfamily
VSALPDEEDRALLSRAGGGDVEAFERLAARHEAALYRFATRVCGGAAAGEDALQEGLLAAWRAAASFRGETRVKSWLFRLVFNAAFQQRALAGRAAAHAPQAPSPADAPALDAVASARQLARLVEQGLAAMAPEAREVLLLRDVEGLGGDEVAEVLGLSLAAMKSRLHRARLELKRRVEEALGGPVREELT